MVLVMEFGALPVVEVLAHVLSTGTTTGISGQLSAQRWPHAHGVRVALVSSS